MDSTVPCFHTSLPITFDLSETLSSVLHDHLVNMDTHIRFLTSSAAISFFFCFFLTNLPQARCEEDDKYLVCNRTHSCGLLRSMYYPFWSEEESRPRYCGEDGFELKCPQDEPPSLQVGSQNFSVLVVDPFGYTMRMARIDIGCHNVCSWDWDHLTNISLSPSQFSYAQTIRNFTIFYGCPAGLSIQRQNFTCANENGKFGYYVEDTHLSKYPKLQNCSFRIQIPFSVDIEALKTRGVDALNTALANGFEVRYNAHNDRCKDCSSSNGICGTDNSSHFSCHCPGGIDGLTCQRNADKPWNWQRKTILGVTGGAIGALLICIAIFYFRSKSSILQPEFWNTTKDHQDIEAFIRNHGPLAPKRYKFSDVKKMTNSFKVKLGQGGYGAVYKGKLLTGCPVAVKILNASKGNGEEFVNEVASIGRTSHVNVVTLVGFCFERHKKALIYEFMPNGSLEKFIYNKVAETTPSLTWENLYQIAIGIARGLEYLHRGCNTRILHFDIKPHNILLDENFCPKISDFGLAKLCPRKDSIVSMSDARGTIGYVAPEVWNRSLGGVSHKSDVYSYGMMLLEMVGGRKNINAEASHTSEIYFPHWVYNKLEQGTNLGVDGILTTEENDIVKRITVVGLWCIQTIPNYRPTISRVIEMLEGTIDSLEMPPKPVLSSPTRSSVPESSTALNSLQSIY